jgi:hypothetical protein
VDAKAVKLRIDIEIDEGAVLGWSNASVENTVCICDGACGTIILALDVACEVDVEDIDVAVDRGWAGLSCPALEPRARMKKDPSWIWKISDSAATLVCAAFWNGKGTTYSRAKRGEEETVMSYFNRRI